MKLPARGEVWWLEPPSDKRRPVLVLTRNGAIPSLRRIVVAPVTTRIRGIPTEVPLDEDHGMPKPCAVTCDNVAVVDRAYLVERITVLGPDRMHAACIALGTALDC